MVHCPSTDRTFVHGLPFGHVGCAPGAFPFGEVVGQYRGAQVCGRDDVRAQFFSDTGIYLLRCSSVVNIRLGADNRAVRQRPRFPNVLIIAEGMLLSP